MAPEKKKTAKKTTAKKPATKKTTAKKSTIKKTTSKKPTAKKTPAKKTPAKITTTKKPTEKKTAEKPNSGFILPKVDINNIMKNITTLPLMFRPGISGFPLETTYFDTEMCAKGFYYLVHNNGKYFLFLPKWNEKVLHEMKTGKHIVITRGSHKGIKDSFEIMFDDNTETPFSVIIIDEQFTRLSPLKEGWHGKLYVYSGDIDECRLIFSYVYYRITDNLPCLEPVKEEIDKLHNLTALSHDEAVTALKSGERLVNGVDSYGVAHYHLFGNEILISDSYYDLHGEGVPIQENKLPQLYRMGDGNFGNPADYVRFILKPLLESGNFPKLSRRLNLEKLTQQLSRGCTNDKASKMNFEVILTQLENSIKF